MQNRIYPLHITLIDIPRVFENSLHGGRRRQDRIFEKNRVQNRDITAVAAKVRRNNASQIPNSAGDKNFFRTHLKIPFRLRYGIFGCGFRLPPPPFPPTAPGPPPPPPPQNPPSPP